ncbi:MAG: Type secretory pathway component PulK-like protein [Planctomycetaceae bacterium]|nr:Type secretory pathway component PulK-like protein [Planctomycetaceae bacterium]
MNPYRRHIRRSIPRRQPRGLVLIVVLVVIVLLSLGAYTFSEYMVIENKSANFHGKTIQARALADSGVEFVSAILSNRAHVASVGLFHNPGLFQGHLMINSVQAGGRGRFTVIAPVEGDISARNVRFGLIDESSKLNLNTVAKLQAAADAAAAATGTANAGTASGSSSTDSSSGSTDTTLANPLMGLPGMTLEISEAIFDWIDEDDDQREHGAENEIYQSLNPPYECKNQPLETLDELLLIRGITPQLLFGEDANRNGLLDPNENDGPLTPPLDNADGMLDRGWAAYLTVHSRELNLQPDRALRIDVNKNTLDALYDSLVDAFDEDSAKFIVAYRLYGPVPVIAASGVGTGGTGGTGNSGGGSPAGGNSGGGRSTSSGAGRSSGGGGAPSAAAAGINTQQLAQLAQLAGQAMAGQAGTVTRGGMNLAGGGPNKITSIYNLIGAQVKGMIDGTTQTLDSPWKDDVSAIPGYLPKLLDFLSINGSEQFVEGRININQAHREVLIGLPNITEDIVQKIVSKQLRGANGEPLSESDSKRSNTSWLYTDGILDLATLAQLDPFITGKGDVFRMQVIGHFDSGGPVVRIEAILDATQNPPQPIFFRDLTDLGRGYTVPQAPPVSK